MKTIILMATFISLNSFAKINASASIGYVCPPGSHPVGPSGRDCEPDSVAAKTAFKCPPGTVASPNGPRDCIDVEDAPKQ